jgi:hypothetical protein
MDFMPKTYTGIDHHYQWAKILGELTTKNIGSWIGVQRESVTRAAPHSVSTRADPFEL